MVQEVQTSVIQPIETTLDTIQAIGTSSFKIVEGRQTKGGHYVGGGKTTGGRYQYTGSTTITSPVTQISVTLDSSYGKYDYSIVNGGIRVPIAGTYEIEISWYGGAATNSSTIYIKRGTNQNSENIYTNSFGSAGSEVKKIVLDLGKFEIITAWGQVGIYGGRGSVTGATTLDYIKITQL